jgi:hypothetical protein
VSFIYEQPLIPSRPSFAGGEASTSDLYASARDAALFADNFNASELALERAYDARNDAIFKATGTRLQNPLRAIIPAGKAIVRDPNAQKTWTTSVSNLQNQYPDKAREIRAQVPITADAEAQAREAGTRFDMNLASRDDFAAKWATVLGGGFAGSLRDPVQMGTMMLGAGESAGKLAATRILKTALKEAVINGAVEAAMQPQVQAWRAEVGLSSGFDEGVRNTLTAAGFAGILGAGGRAAGEVLQRMLQVPAGTPIEKAINGSDQDAATVLAPIADTLSPEARGALQETEANAAIAAARPDHIPAAEHELRVAASIKAAEDEGPLIEIDLTGHGSKRRGSLSRPLNVMEFMAKAGGLRDDAGELAARGVNTRNSMTFYGPAFRRKGEEVSGGGLFGSGSTRIGKGVPPGMMMEKLQQAGYLVETGGDGLRQLTEQDLYDLVDRHLSGEKIVSLHDRDIQAQLDAEAHAKASNSAFKARWGSDADMAARYGEDIASEYQAMRADGVDISHEDVQFAAQFLADNPRETPRVALDEALIQRVMRNADAARDLDPALQNVPEPPPFDLEDYNARLDQAGRPVQRGSGGDTGSTGQGIAAGERAAVAAAGRVADERPVTPKATGGTDDITAPEVAAATDAQLKAVEAEIAALQRDQSMADLNWMFDTADYDARAERISTLSALVRSCKVM